MVRARIISPDRNDKTGLSALAHTPPHPTPSLPSRRSRAISAGLLDRASRPGHHRRQRRPVVSATPPLQRSGCPRALPLSGWASRWRGAAPSGPAHSPTVVAGTLEVASCGTSQKQLFGTTATKPKSGTQRTSQHRASARRDGQEWRPPRGSWEWSQSSGLDLASGRCCGASTAPHDRALVRAFRTPAITA